MVYVLNVEVKRATTSLAPPLPSPPFLSLPSSPSPISHPCLAFPSPPLPSSPSPISHPCLPLPSPPLPSPPLLPPLPQPAPCVVRYSELPVHSTLFCWTVMLVSLAMLPGCRFTLCWSMCRLLGGRFSRDWSGSCRQGERRERGSCRQHTGSMSSAPLLR